MNITFTIDIPALDRLCGWLESRDKAGLVAAIENEIVAKLKEAAEGGAPKPAFREVEPTDDHPWKDEAASEPREGPQEPPTPEPTHAPDAAEKSSTLADVQQACARLRDAGKIAEVKGLFPEFGIKKLSDLKSADQLAAFAARLKKLEG